MWSPEAVWLASGFSATVRLMTAIGNRVLQDALALSEQERAEIAARLIESLEVGPDDDSGEVEAAWAAEIERRCAALDAGTTGTSDWADVRRQIKTVILRK